ncbi:hypothetical protein DAI22_01g395850 [Oryza sativa Japonica Group]|nr:hypothetical protein DAI22_01g395850 [Oryza sativa Japonica Group]
MRSREPVKTTTLAWTRGLFQARSSIGNTFASARNGQVVARGWFGNGAVLRTVLFFLPPQVSKGREGCLTQPYLLLSMDTAHNDTTHALQGRLDT